MFGCYILILSHFWRKPLGVKFGLHVGDEIKAKPAIECAGLLVIFRRL